MHPARDMETLVVNRAIHTEVSSKQVRARSLNDSLPRGVCARAPGTSKRPRKSFREKTFVAGIQQRKREFDKQMQILKDRGAALAVSTGSEIALGVVTREGEPVLWCTPGLEEFMVRAWREGRDGGARAPSSPVGAALVVVVVVVVWPRAGDREVAFRCGCGCGPSCAGAGL